MGLSEGQDTPLYREVARQLRDSIDEGELPPGAPLPTEKELAERYDVSRNTVRLALAQLTHEGLISTGRGRGGRRVRRPEPLTFHGSRSRTLDDGDDRRMTSVDTWVVDAHEQGRRPGQAISVAIEEATAEIAERLEIKKGAPVVVRRRIRTIDGEPHNLADTYYPMDIAAGTPIMHPPDVRPGVIAWLRDKGYEQRRCVDELTWRMPTPEEQRRLEVPVGVPVLVQTRTGYSTARPIRVAVTTWPGDRTRIVYELPTLGFAPQPPCPARQAD